MQRQRLTRKAEQDKQASPPPQMPAVDRTEGPASPAYYPDPEMDKYEKGDTSAWAEDPHSPMDPESPPPAMPGNLTTEDLTHPATSDFQKKPETPAEAMAQGGGGGKEASAQPSLRELAEKRASLCIRIATAAMPGSPTSEIEERALQLMDKDDAHLKAALDALSIFAKKEDDKDEEFEKGEESEGTEMFDEDKDASKKAAVELTAATNRIAKLERSLTRVIQAMNHFFSSDEDDKGLMAYLMAEDMDGDGVDQNQADYGYSDHKGGEEEEMEEMDLEAEASSHDEDHGEEEAMLRAMLDEMDAEMRMASHSEEVVEPLAKGESIQSGEGGNVNPDERAHTPQVAQADGKDKTANEENPADNDIQITAGADPMGLMDKEGSADDELLALYADLNLPKTAGEEEEDEEDVEVMMEEDEKEASKKANDAPKPQRKAASAGVQNLGTVQGQSKVASDEVAELSKLWETAPNVNEKFGLPQ